ncbi:FxsA family protein [Nocardioides sp.]|uniref:FxsA family protein n=1 Tax=Nocardioides sp. TaxID=35761 RepID=UPI002B50CE71|nr:FxsA family protein [Nocardioides sp.]HSX67963.1 FxsA family protein [Nocardioides sp.]
MTSSVRRVPGWLLALLFIGVPLLELIVIVRVGQTIGVGWTILLLIVDSIVGAWLLKREGGRALTALGTAFSSGRMPAREIADGMLILVGGVLMLTPGFLSDVLGFLCILPMTRPLARGLLTRFVATRLVVVPGGAFPGGPFSGGSTFPGSTPPGNGPRPRPGGHGDVVQGEVVED